MGKTLLTCLELKLKSFSRPLHTIPSDLLSLASMDQLRSLLPSLRAAVAANTAAAPALLQQCRLLLIELPSAQSATAAPSEDELALTRACPWQP